ncbi:MAG: hypothetical protein VKL60_20925 [Sphaerospermopsis sp.]|nr:hypothetical protein [Sphaerospermopsis sp.]
MESNVRDLQDSLLGAQKFINESMSTLNKVLSESIEDSEDIKKARAEFEKLKTIPVNAEIQNALNQLKSII